MMPEKVPLKSSIEIVHFDRDGNVISIEKEDVPYYPQKKEE